MLAAYPPGTGALYQDRHRRDRVVRSNARSVPVGLPGVHVSWQVNAHGSWGHQSRGGPPVAVRLLTNIGRLWTGSEILSNAAIVTGDERIAWVGPAAELPQRIPGVVDDIVDVDHVENLGGGLVTPGLIDAHTHPVYAGNRWAELAMRSNGSSAAEITAAGGGVSSTVTVTRGTDPWTLCNGVRERLGRWLRSGTTTIEAKTGYHLTRDGELADVRMLRSLEGEPGMPRVHVTFLAAHAVPPEFFGRRTDYIDAVSSWCPAAALQSGARPPVRALLDKGVAVALGSDHAPGTIGVTSMALVISLAVSVFGMSVEEALRAATIGGAHALRAPDRGAMVRGRLADMVLWDADHEGAFVWSYGLTPRRVWLGGEPISAS